jgi:hypothetical protein
MSRQTVKSKDFIGDSRPWSNERLVRIRLFGETQIKVETFESAPKNCKCFVVNFVSGSSLV